MLGSVARTGRGTVPEAGHAAGHLLLVLRRKLPERTQREVHGVNARLRKAPEEDVDEWRKVLRRQAQHSRGVVLTELEDGQRARVGDGGVAEHRTRHGGQHRLAALEDALHDTCGGSRTRVRLRHSDVHQTEPCSFNGATNRWPALKSQMPMWQELTLTQRIPGCVDAYGVGMHPLRIRKKRTIQRYSFRLCGAIAHVCGLMSRRAAEHRRSGDT